MRPTRAACSAPTTVPRERTLSHPHPGETRPAAQEYGAAVRMELSSKHTVRPEQSSLGVCGSFAANPSSALRTWVTC